MFKYNSEFSVLGCNEAWTSGVKVADADSEEEDTGGVEINSATTNLLFAL